MVPETTGSSRARGFTGDPTAPAHWFPWVIDRCEGLPSVPAQKCARVGSIGPVCSANCSVGIAGIVRWSWLRFHAQIPRGRVEIIRPRGVPVGRLRVTAG